jgi:hypothetical protein
MNRLFTVVDDLSLPLPRKKTPKFSSVYSTMMMAKPETGGFSVVSYFVELPRSYSDVEG